MRQVPEGTFIEAGDPCFVSLRLACCPLCGVELFGNDGSLGTISGHVRTPLGQHAETVSFAACTEHFEAAKGVLVKHRHQERAGYIGQWEPRLGLTAEISWVKEDGLHTRQTFVRII